MKIGWEAELRKIFEATREDGIEGVVETREIVRDDLGRVAVDVILKMSAEKAGAIPWQAAGPRLEEEAGAFDSAEGEDVVAGAEDSFYPRQSAGADADCGVAFGNELDCVGMKPEMDIGVSGEGSMVETGKVRFRAPAREVGFEIGKLGKREAQVAPDGFIAALNFGEAFELES